jgi:hypothetical protein
MGNIFAAKEYLYSFIEKGDTVNVRKVINVNFNWIKLEISKFY